MLVGQQPSVVHALDDLEDVVELIEGETVEPSGVEAAHGQPDELD